MHTDRAVRGIRPIAPGARWRVWASRLVVAGAIGSSSSCDGQFGDQQVDRTFQIVAGDGQFAVVGTAVPIAPTVLVNNNGSPVSGVEVTFRINEGGGVLTGNIATTGRDGRASLGQWVLGSNPGEMSITAEIADVNGTIESVLFTATATALPSMAIFIHEGSGQSALVGTAVAVDPAVIVTRTGVPVAGETVNFTVTAGAGTVSPLSRVTGADGIVRVDQWILGAAGVNTLTASLGASPTTFTTFTATGTEPPRTFVSVAVVCTSIGQVCAPRFGYTLTTAGMLDVEFTIGPTCSALQIEFFVDGAQAASPRTIAISTTNSTTGVINLGPVSSGSHLVELQATGFTGGCNTGRLFSWAGAAYFGTN